MRCENCRKFFRGQACYVKAILVCKLCFYKLAPQTRQRNLRLKELEHKKPLILAGLTSGATLFYDELPRFYNPFAVPDFNLEEREELNLMD